MDILSKKPQTNYDGEEISKKQMM